MRSSRAKILIAALWVLPITLGPGAKAHPAEKAADGKALYKQNCRVCHTKDSANGEYTPLTLIQDQWKRFFKEKLVPAHKQAVVPGGASPLLESLTPDQLKAIEKFCVDHAADSEQPQTCS